VEWSAEEWELPKEVLARAEIAATRRRVDELIEADRFPYPRGDWPAIPWPPF